MIYSSKEMVYLLIPADHLYSDGCIKIGRSRNNTLDRMKSYGKDSVILTHVAVENSRFVENKLKDTFKEKFMSIKSGNEFYKGDLDEMILVFLKKNESLLIQKLPQK